MTAKSDASTLPKDWVTALGKRGYGEGLAAASDSRLWPVHAPS
jgi:hypothetical protein